VFKTCRPLLLLLTLRERQPCLVSSRIGFGKRSLLLFLATSSSFLAAPLAGYSAKPKKSSAQVDGYGCRLELTFLPSIHPKYNIYIYIIIYILKYNIIKET